MLTPGVLSKNPDTFPTHPWQVIPLILNETSFVSPANKVSIEDKNCKISYDAALTNPEAIKTELSKTHFTISDVVVEKQNSSIFSWIKNIFN